MKVFTQEEYDAIKRDKYGVKHLPSGDYSQVVIKDGRCSVAAGCEFGAGCDFGAWCEFGAECNFGAGCDFGARCEFDDGCELGDRCKVGDGCEFGVRCRFGELFVHGKNTTFEGGAVKNGTFMKVGRIGSEMRDAYFFIDENGKLFVRAGCWFSDMDSFIERVHRVHGGTRHERQYLAACEYAKAVLPEMLEEVNNG